LLLYKTAFYIMATLLIHMYGVFHSLQRHLLFKAV